MTKPVVLFWLVVTAFILFVHTSHSYIHTPCTRSVRPQFQFPDCYVPSMNTSLLLSEASFVMSHNAGTGYIIRGKPSPSGFSWFYSQNQVGNAYQQLNDGARALDIRPKLLQNGTIILQHDAISIPTTLQQLVTDALQWCHENPDELVVLLTSNYEYQYSNNTNDMVSALSDVYSSLGVNYVSCNDVYGLTVLGTMQLAALLDGGYLLALDGQDSSSSGGSFCYKSNWVESRLVPCYTKLNGTVTSCTSNYKPWIDLQQYVLESTNNEPTNDRHTLGPPANSYDKPFNCIQALWQVTVSSATIGLSKLSNLLRDNQKSGINAKLVDMVYEERQEFQSPLSLFMVDNVALNGNALFSVLRTTCGQSTLEQDACGRAVPKPSLTYFHFSNVWKALLLMMYTGIFVWIVYLLMKKDGSDPNKILLTLVARLKGDGTSV